MRIIFMLSALLAGNTLLNAQYPHHVIHAVINHSTKEITVADTIIFPAVMTDNSSIWEFTLNSNLILENTGADISIEKIENHGKDGFDRYRLILPSNRGGKAIIPVRYSGKIAQEIETGAAEYARGFSSTDGIISPEGIYLAGSSGWLPSFKMSKLFTFNLTADLEEAWSLVTQGTRTTDTVVNHRRKVQYDNPDPMDEVYFIAGKWTEYSTRDGNVLIQAFLRTPDEALANQYLGVTSYYLAMYKDLIGEYPYTKFALVENFWETGYGMPSFTLLGEMVIRFPWILHSSYPHELLHNYWGNSVFVDYSKGNWCEGITAYMADHLIKEQQGLADDYRRTTLQKFTDYVNPENDFPISEFISRNNPAEEAIGYGKVLMFNNMLREEFGDEVFRMAYADLYKRNRFRYASWDDIQLSFERITEKDLQPMFDQWILRKGSPSLQLSDVNVTATDEGYELTYILKQLQDEKPFSLNIPVAIYLENIQEVYVTNVRMDARERALSLNLDNRPLKISVDPQFNLMRSLHYSEVPSSLSQLLGAKRSAIILPGESSHTDNYRKLAEFWKETLAVQGKEMEILYDTDIEEIPSDMPVWVAGFGNRFYEGIKINELYQDVLPNEEQSAILDLTRDQSLVYAIPNQSAPEKTIGFIGTHYPESIIVLARKLQHYGSYGYLGFTGSEFTNVLQGGFPVLNSALDHVIPYEDHPSVNQKLKSRRALAYPSEK
jgi:aminopeptidase N